MMNGNLYLVLKDSTKNKFKTIDQCQCYQLTPSPFKCYTIFIREKVEKQLKCGMTIQSNSYYSQIM